jgi:hypothetical protein
MGLDDGRAAAGQRGKRDALLKTFGGKLDLAGTTLHAGARAAPWENQARQEVSSKLHRRRLRRTPVSWGSSRRTWRSDTDHPVACRTAREVTWGERWRHASTHKTWAGTTWRLAVSKKTEPASLRRTIPGAALTSEEWLPSIT